MRFSVIVPTYNRKESLKRCLDSIMRQSYEDFEVIVVDDGSTDGTEKLAHMCKGIEYVRIKHAGPGAARNAGISKASGEFLAFTDDDCIVGHDWLKRIEAAFSRTGADAVGGMILPNNASYVMDSNHFLVFSRWMQQSEQLMENIAAANIAFRKSAIDGLRFDENLKNYEDALFNLSFTGGRKRIAYIPEILVMHICQKTFNELASSQKDRAAGFLMGGYLCHGKIGYAIQKAPLLAFTCPNAAYTILNSAKSKRLLSCMAHLPAMLILELLWAWHVCLGSLRAGRD